MTPAVSVVMPVFNAEAHLVDAIASVLGQTFRDFELICVNDGSGDSSGAILDWFASQDSRIHVLHQQNQGIVGALNAGCALGKAPLIMRMDSDDLCLAKRMEIQLRYFDNHQGCVACGTGILEMDAESDPLSVSRLPRDHESIHSNLLQRLTGHFHPSVMFRRRAFELAGGYRLKYQWVEDHDLWLRMSRHGELANLPDVMLCYRQHASSVCWQRSAQQRELMNQLLRETYTSLSLDLPESVLMSSEVQRSAAGPGKWARMAAKGGYSTSALKHLRKLNASEARLGYKLRMNLETLGRVAAGNITSLMKGSRDLPISVPKFDEWNRRWREARVSGSLVAA